MIILDICAVLLVILGAGIYWEVRWEGRRARARFKVEGLHRFK